MSLSPLDSMTAMSETVSGSRMYGGARFTRLLSMVLMITAICGCSSLDNILDVPPPAGVQTGDDLNSRSGAETRFAGAKARLADGFGGQQQLVYKASLLSDELTVATAYPSYDAADARYTVFGANSDEPGDYAFQSLLAARSSLLLAAGGLAQYEPASDQYKAGEALALVGYVELWLAEHYCAGVVLDRALPNGGVEYGHPLTTDSLFATAEAHFDSALAYAGENTTVHNLASIGLGRARLGRGHYTDAAAAVSDVATDFVYNTQAPTSYTQGNPNFWQSALGNGNCSFFNVSDREGGNGLDYISANDPRLVFDTTAGMTCNQASGISGAVPFYFPRKFGPPATSIPIATGIEARLIEAEAALQNHQPSIWASTLNTLRTNGTFTTAPRANPQTHADSIAIDTTWAYGTGRVGGQVSGVRPLMADSTSSASDALRIDVMFRERAFWLFGDGTRVGDLRRLIRAYGRAPNSVFPTGSYGGGQFSVTSYGDDVSFSVPTTASGNIITNPYYQGCLTQTDVQ